MMSCRMSGALSTNRPAGKLLAAVSHTTGASQPAQCTYAFIIPIRPAVRHVSCRLSGALGLDRLTEKLVEAVAGAAGVAAPAQPGTPAEAKQVVALETLLQVASGPRAGLLGSSWVLLLRTLSELEALQVLLPCLTRETGRLRSIQGFPSPIPHSMVEMPICVDPFCLCVLGSLC